MARGQGLERAVQVDSCGTGGWHAGEAPDRRASTAARRRGYELSHLRARQVTAEDFRRFDYILAMDRQNLRDLQALAPGEFPGRLGLFLDYAEGRDEREVPDPYYGGPGGFDHVLDLVEEASAGLLREISRASAG